MALSPPRVLRFSIMFVFLLILVLDWTVLAQTLDVATLPTCVHNSVGLQCPTYDQTCLCLAFLDINNCVKSKCTDDPPDTGALIAIDEFCRTFLFIFGWLISVSPGSATTGPPTTSTALSSQTTSTTLTDTGSHIESTSSAGICSLLFAIKLLMYRSVYQ